jgi:sugar/nucleoside kinase (ribokinase family)
MGAPRPERSRRRYASRDDGLWVLPRPGDRFVASLLAMPALGDLQTPFPRLETDSKLESGVRPAFDIGSAALDTFTAWKEHRTMKPHDVFSYGVISSSTLYRIHGAFPSPEGYAEIDDFRYMTGGEATNSSIVLSRLGVPVKLDGNWLGDDDNGERTKALLSDYQIDTSRLPLREGYKGVQEVVFAAADTRTIFGTYGRLLERADWNMPHETDIAEAKVVCLDPFFEIPAAQVAETAFSANIPVVTVDCKYDNPLLRHVAAIVVSASFLRENYPDHDRESVFRDYQAATGGLTIFTFADAPAWYARPDEAVRYFQPYSIDPVDTTGGGDAFRAGVVYGFLKGWSDDKIIDFAAAVAAMNCTRFPGVLNTPTLDEVADFMSGAPQPPA